MPCLLFCLCPVTLCVILTSAATSKNKARLADTEKYQRAKRDVVDTSPELRKLNMGKGGKMSVASAEEVVKLRGIPSVETGGALETPAKYEDIHTVEGLLATRDKVCRCSVAL